MTSKDQMGQEAATQWTLAEYVGKKVSVQVVSLVHLTGELVPEVTRDLYSVRVFGANGDNASATFYVKEVARISSGGTIILKTDA